MFSEGRDHVAAVEDGRVTPVFVPYCGRGGDKPLTILRNVSSILRQLFPEFSEQCEMCPQAVDMWTTAKRRSCPHTHSHDDDDVMFRHRFVAAG